MAHGDGDRGIRLWGWPHLAFLFDSMEEIANAGAEEG